MYLFMNLRIMAETYLFALKCAREAIEQHKENGSNHILLKR